MKNTFILWKDIIANPFEGYKGLNENTKILVPLLTIIVLFILSITMIVPILISEPYGDAVVRSQVAAMAERGTEMSAEQQAAMAEQMTSPMVKNITIASSYAGGLITFFLMTLATALILKLMTSSMKKDKVKFSLVFKIILFASIIGMVQSILKMGITLTGNWERSLSRVNEAGALQQVLQTPISLAALFDASGMNRTLYMLIDTLTDVFNWIYYIFIYAGLKVAVELEKKKALIATVIIAVISIAIGAAFTLIG